MTEELGSIGVKLRVDLSDLDRAETAAKRKISGIAREWPITFKVGAVNVEETRRQVRALTAGKLDVKATVSLYANAGTLLKRQLQAQLKAAGPVSVRVTGDLSAAEVTRIKKAIGKAEVKIGTPGGGSSGTTATGPVTAHERRVNEDVATRTAAKVARSTPKPPAAAAQSAAPAPGRFSPGHRTLPTDTAFLQKRAADDLAKSAKSAEAAAKSAKTAAESASKTAKAATPAAKPAAAPAAAPAAPPKAAKAAKAAKPAAARPAPAVDDDEDEEPKRKGRAKAAPARPITRPMADFGSLPTGPAVGVSYAPDPKTGQRMVVPEPNKGVGKRLSRAGQRASAQGMSMNTLKNEKVRVPQVAPEDEEYASRSVQGRIPLTEYEQELAERNLHGVRGAGRSGARQRNEPVLTDLERQVKDTLLQEGNTTSARARDAETRAPARRSGAYFGSSKSPRFNRMVAGLQFTAFDPALAAAQKALEAGDLDGARTALRGFSGNLAGADPRRRKKFFRLFRNVENAPPEVLEKHAALQGLFAEIGNQEAERRVATTQATLAPFRAGKSGKALRESTPDAYSDAMEAAKAAKKFQMDMLRGLRPRGGGGRVEGMFPKTKIDSSLGGLLNDKRTLKELERFQKDFPISAGKIREIRDISDLHPDKGGNAGVMDGGTTLAFNPGYIEKALKSGSRGSVAHRSGRSSDVVVHELGHLVDRESERTLSGAAGKPISRYGATSPEENAAELFTQRHGLRGLGARLTHRGYFSDLKLQSQYENNQFEDQEARRAAAAAKRASFSRAGGGRVRPATEGLFRPQRKGKFTEGIRPRLARDIVGKPIEDIYGNFDPTPDGEHNPFEELGDDMFDPRRRGSISGYGGLWKLANRVRSHAAGGAVQGGLAARLAAVRAAKDAYLVADGHKDELFVGDSGKMEILKQPAHIRTFDEPGKVEPYVPEWVRRGMPKDLTRRAPGGRTRAFRGRKGPTIKGEGFETWSESPYIAEERKVPSVGPVRGFGGRANRSFAPGEKEAIAGGLLTKGDSASVQRVFVVNFPPGGGIAGTRGGSVAAGPLRFGSDKEAKSFAASLGGSIGKELKDLLGSTREVREPKEPVAETVKPAALSPEEKVSSRISAIGEGSPREIRAVLTGIKSSLSETQSQSPVRSLAPAFGQITATILGRGELLKRLAVARDLTAQAARAEGIWTGELTKENNIRKQLETTDDPAAKEQLVKDLEAQGKATKSAADFTKGLVKEAEGAAKAADSMGLKIGVLLGNTIGIVGGTLAFGATLAAAQAGITAVTTVLSPAIERMSGFSNVSAKVTSALADQTKALGGASEAAFATTAAQSGIGRATEEAIGPLLRQRAEIEAGNKTVQQGLELLHTFEEARRRGGQQGLTTTTGGFFGSIIGGIASTQEIIKGELNSPDAQLGSTAADAPAAIAALKAKRESLTGTYRGQQGQAIIDTQIKALAGTPDVLNDRLAFFNDSLKRGGSALKFVAGASREVANEFARTADRAGLTEIGDTARGSNRVILVDKNGTPVSNGDQIKAALAAINQSQQTPDPALLIKQLTERIIPAQLAQFRAQSNFQRAGTIPAQFALGEIAQPTAGLKGGPEFEAGLVGKGDKLAAKSAAAIKKEIGGAIEYVNTQIDKGREALVNLVPADLKGEFTGILDEITATGQQISKLQTGISQQQVNLAVKEYNNQLRIANRSLQDAKDLQAGIRGATRDTVGGLEGQNILLQRQLQLLGFQLQQRQINFSVATAGFVAPGTTPEERAARIEQAKTEAAFAQKQLDIQKQLAGNQFKSLTLPGIGEVARQITDLNAQINLLTQGRELVVNTASTNKALDILNKKQKLLLDNAATYIEEGVKITQAAIEAAGEVQKATGEGFKSLLAQTAKAWGIFGEQAQVVLNALTGSAPTPTPSRPGGKRPEGHGQANGIVGDTLGPTQLTVGEAAGEKVAILRNPKLVPSSSLYGSAAGGTSAGPTSISMQIIITGNTVREESDIEALAERVARKVEDRLNQKTSLFGLRRA